MRPLLFTGKTINGNKWIIGKYKEEIDDNDNITYRIYDRNFDCEVRPETICQYTGSRDVNNRGIYEGDILITNTTSMEIKVIVQWNEEDACFELVYENGVRYGEFKKSKVSNWHVIGNIHDANLKFNVSEEIKINE